MFCFLARKYSTFLGQKEVFLEILPRKGTARQNDQMVNLS
jgi:hypothetical protein